VLLADFRTSKRTRSIHKKCDQNGARRGQISGPSSEERGEHGSRDPAGNVRMDSVEWRRGVGKLRERPVIDLWVV